MPPSVDREWAQSLVGLRMLVEKSWWEGGSGSDLCPGLIVDVDFSDDAGRFFILQHGIICFASRGSSAGCISKQHRAALVQRLQN